MRFVLSRVSCLKATEPLGSEGQGCCAPLTCSRSLLPALGSAVLVEEELIQSEEPRCFGFVCLF